jgi:glutathione peroxidase
MASAYDFSFTTLTGAPYALKDLAGKPFMVVNTASQCGFTGQYKGLQAVYEEYAPKGFTIVGVPSNDFGGQEPGSNDEIGAFCQKNYGVTFPMMGKVPVKGAAAHPFFTWAAGQGGFLAGPKWNFFKYLVAKDGSLSTWFSSVASPDSQKFVKAVEQII